MKILLVLLSVLGWSLPAWAEYRRTPGTRFDVSELTSEFDNAGVDLQGASCRREWSEVICEKMQGDFTDAEKALMDAVLLAHDPDVKAKREARRKAAKASGDAKLKAMGLADEEIEAR